MSSPPSAGQGPHHGPDVHPAVPGVVPPLDERLAGAPISWGVSEVPGWGWQLDAATVLREMAGIGLAATELGPEGFLPADPAEAARVLADAGLVAVGQFVPLVLHDPGHDPLPELETALDGILAAGADTCVVAAASGISGYDARPALDDAALAALHANLDRVDEAARSRGVVAALHPHVGTMVETGEETERALASSGIGLCLDTGHLAVAGADVVALTRRWATRVRHVHLKDVRAALAAQVRAGERTFADAVAAGVFVPLGDGDAHVDAVVTLLEDAGYAGWYVLEQDVALTGPPEGEGPVGDVEVSLNHLLGLSAQRSGVGI